jgi:hypothetical protein
MMINFDKVMTQEFSVFEVAPHHLRQADQPSHWELRSFVSRID